MSPPAEMVWMPDAAFRDTREYVHSTDIYEEVLAGAVRHGLSIAGPFRMTIRAQITRRPQYRYSDGAAYPASCAVVLFQVNGQPWSVSVTETNEAVAKRKPYDESPAASARINSNSITLNQDTRLRPIEALTALAVVLHKTVRPPPPEKRWMLGQLAVSRLLQPDDARQLAITIDRELGDGLTRCRITAIDGDIGHMLFALAPAGHSGRAKLDGVRA